MKKIISVLSISALFPLAAAWAQIAVPNEAGVSWGQWHTIVRDVEASKKFWTTVGGTPVKIDGVDAMKFPGIFIFLTKGSPPAGGNYGATLNHVAFLVPDSQETLARWKAAGVTTQFVKPQLDLAGPPLAYAYTPEDLKIRLNSMKNQTVPITGPLVMFWVTKPLVPEVVAWYSKMFGGNPGRKMVNDGQEVAGIPGGRLNAVSSAGNPVSLKPLTVGLVHGAVPDEAFVKELIKPGLMQPTKGRTLDHIGFEVKNLEEYCKKLEADGVKFDQPYSKTRHQSFASAELTDPWGVSIELTEGLNRF